MSDTVTINGTDYSLTDGDYSLAAVFKKSSADAGHFSTDVFEANVVSYHSDESFRAFVQDAYDEQGENHPNLLLVAFGGPAAIAKVMRDARKAGIKSALRGAARKEKPWEAKLMAVLSEVMHEAGAAYYAENKDSLFEKCGVPNDARTDDYVQVLVNSGKGNLGCKVHTMEATSQWGKEGKYSLTLAYRIDINNKTRASNKTTAAPANGEGEAQPSAK